jgi:hypothetical protein
MTSFRVQLTKAIKAFPMQRLPLCLHMVSWGGCYDHNFLRFLPILAFFSKTKVLIKFLENLALGKNVNIFARLFGENIYKIITSGPGQTKFIDICRLFQFCHNSDD